MNNLIEKIKINLSKDASIVLIDELEMAKDKGFNITTIKGLLEVFTDTETVHQLNNYSHFKNIQSLINEIVEALKGMVDGNTSPLFRYVNNHMELELIAQFAGNAVFLRHNTPSIGRSYIHAKGCSFDGTNVSWLGGTYDMMLSSAVKKLFNM